MIAKAAKPVAVALSLDDIRTASQRGIHLQVVFTSIRSSRWDESDYLMNYRNLMGLFYVDRKLFALESSSTD